MIYKCPNCNASLEYNAELDKMQCRYCNGVYGIGELEEENKADEYVEVKAMTYDDEEETMSCKIYYCTSCAAELMVNDVEVSTFCAYCGQPTIVFSRVSGEQRPKYILPFSITKEDAAERIRARIKSAKFVPRKIKNYSVENIRGIYIPYCLYNIIYSDEQAWKQEPFDKRIQSTKIYKRAASHTFKDFPVVMSMRMDATLSQRLEPFDMSYKRPFSPEYLSGYYADKYDMSMPQTDKIANDKMKELFNRAIRETIDGIGVEMTYSQPRKKILSSDYALLPAWFLTFRYKKRPYTFIVNGQTGKVIGALPVQKMKAILFFIITALIVCPSCAVMLAALGEFLCGLGYIGMDMFGVLVLGFIGPFSLWFYKSFYVQYKETKKAYMQAASSEFAKYAHERQDK